MGMEEYFPQRLEKLFRCRFRRALGSFETRASVRPNRLPKCTEAPERSAAIGRKL